MLGQPNPPAGNDMNQTVILLAEDDANDVFLFRRAVQKAGLASKVVDVPDGREAVQYLSGEPPYANRALFPVPDLLLLDLKMPLMDGFDVLGWKKTRPELADLPAIVLSSSTIEADIKRAQSLGALDYLIKPSDTANLLRLVQELHERWLAREK